MKYYTIYGANWYLNARDCRIWRHNVARPGHSFGLSFRLIKKTKIMKIKLRIVKGGACDYSKTYCKNVNIRWSLSKWNDRLFIGFRLTKKLKV